MSLYAINTLVDREVIKFGTELEARYLGRSLDGVNTILMQDLFSVYGIIKNKDNKVKSFILTRIRDAEKYRVAPENIVAIDGMDPSRVLEAFELENKDEIKKKKTRSYKHTKADGSVVDYTEIVYTMTDGKIKRERYDENGNKVQRGRKKKIKETEES